ncbi:uncharacterized protein [Antedon mediterranea]|uniref:uncharacterized protein n=1 Tax=Antedon mediterranea TaxID=105859 RepID=UPI003AF97BF3
MRSNEPTLEVLDYFMNQGASVTALNKDGNTPMHEYMRSNEPTLGIVNYLTKQGASVTSLNKDGNTPLHEYMRSSEPTLEVVVYLTKQGASVTALNKDGNTPLHEYMCSNKPTLEAVNYLRKQGASITALNKEGKTAVSVLEENTKIEKTKQIMILEHFDKLLVPPEIFAMGKEAIKIYKDELKDGKIAVVNSRCMFLGKEGAGKTSCVKSMLRERFNPKEQSTDGIVTATVFKATGESKWKKIKEENDSELTKKMRENALAEKVDKKLKQDSNENRSLWNKFEDFIRSKIGSDDLESISNEITSIWDYAGQLDYYITHRVCLSIC